MNIEQLLKEKDLSITKNRKLILECLNDNHDHFHSISDISKHIGNINTKSIYNNIKQLMSIGLVDSISSGGITKYAINENTVNGSHEIHIVNSEGKISHMEINKSIFDEIEKEAKKSGLKTTSIKITITTK